MMNNAPSVVAIVGLVNAAASTAFRQPSHKLAALIHQHQSHDGILRTGGSCHGFTVEPINGDDEWR